MVPAARGGKVLLDASGNTADIIKAIKAADAAIGPQTKPLSTMLSTGNAYTDGMAVHNWIRNNISYIEDPEGEQLIPTPARVLHNGFADCKGMSLLANNILKGMGHRCAYRFARYYGSPSPGRFSHVFAQVFDATRGGHYFCDPTIAEYNYDDTAEYSGSPRVVEAKPFTDAPVAMAGRYVRTRNIYTA
jgi:transglutaminase-like putative cysteine protease